MNIKRGNNTILEAVMNGFISEVFTTFRLGCIAVASSGVVGVVVAFLG